MRTSVGVRIAYAANRAIGLDALRALLSAGITPVALLAPGGGGATHIADMRALLPAGTPFLEGTAFRTPQAMAILEGLDLDYVLSVHFPYVFPPAFLSLAKVGCLNLHPAFLPYNRGWHTPSWAIVEGTAVGATLHWIDAGIDTGDIALQERIEIRPNDTAHSLYSRMMQAEMTLFERSIAMIREGTLPRIPQAGPGTTHSKSDLRSIQEIDLDATGRMGTLIDRLRALTTNSLEEAAWFRVNGKRYRVRVEFFEDKESPE